MANRYWVGGTGDWDASTTTHWSATSGGAGGESVPSSSDVAIFNASSGGGTVTLTTSPTISSLNFGAFTGTITIGANNFTCKSVIGSGSGTRTINMGSGLWTLTGDALVWNFEVITNLTFNKQTANIKYTGTTGSSTFRGGGLTYNDFWNDSSVTNYINIRDSNTFADLKVSAGGKLQFEGGKTQTVSSLTAVGSVGNIIILTGVNTGGGLSWTISDSSGTNNVSYCEISYSTATGGAVWDANDGTNVDSGNNTGWLFPIFLIADVGSFSLTGISNNLSRGFTFVTEGSGETLIDSYPESNGSASLSVISNGYAGQSFLNPTAIPLSKCKFYIQGTVTGSVYAKIYAHTGTFGTNGKPANGSSPLAISDAVDASTIPASFGLVEFTFSGANKITLNDSTYYCIELDNMSDGMISFRADNSSSTHGGNLSYSNDDGATWSTLSTFDGIFYIYGGSTTFSLTGIDALLSKLSGFVLSAVTGAFALTGINNSLIYARKMIASIGTFTLTGLDALLVRVGGFLMSVSTGVFELTGNNNILTKMLHMINSVGTFTLTGINNSWVYARKIIADVGNFTLTGISNILNKGISMVVSAGEFTLIGIDILFEKTKRLISETGNFMVTGYGIMFKGSGSWKIKNLVKNVSSWVDGIKHSSTTSNTTKNNSTWINQDK